MESGRSPSALAAVDRSDCWRAGRSGGLRTKRSGWSLSGVASKRAAVPGGSWSAWLVMHMGVLGRTAVGMFVPMVGAIGRTAPRRPRSIRKPAWARRAEFRILNWDWENGLSFSWCGGVNATWRSEIGQRAEAPLSLEVVDEPRSACRVS